MLRLVVISAFSLALSHPAIAQEFLSSDVPRPMALRNLPFGRDFSPADTGKPNPAAKVPKPRIITKAEWGGAPSSGTLESHTPSKLTLHHAGEVFPPGKDPKQSMRNLQKYGWNQKGWPDIPYHFEIDLDGNIYEARDMLKMGDTNTTYSPAGHLLVCVMGNYEIQVPSDKQLNAIIDLYAWLSDYWNINPETLRCHMEYASTQCPGKNLYPYAASGYFEGEIRKRLREAYGVTSK